MQGFVLLGNVHNLFIADFSLLFWQGSVAELILRSGIFAKTILLSLVILSIISWTITLVKYWQYKAFNDSFLKAVNSIRPNTDPNGLYRLIVKEIGGPAGRIFEEGFLTLKMHVDWLKQSDQIASRGSLVTPEKDMQLRMEATTESELSELASGTSFLATVVSVSPFLGLLGTVWGVMYTFMSIGQAGSAELSVVAPGIAEALITTITGLAVAIPALMCNNFLGTRLLKIEDDLSRLNAELIIFFTHIWHREKAKIETHI